MITVCRLCKGEVDTRSPNTHRLVTGWTKARKQGGTNAVRFPTPHDHWAHGTCVDSAVKGISPMQEDLFHVEDAA